MNQLISYVNPFAEVASINSSNRTPNDIQIEIGKSNFLIDGFRNLMSLPTKLLFWNSNINSGNISPDVIEKVKNYLHKEGLHDVAVSVNQYKPQEVWARIFTNPKTSFLSKLTLGMTSGWVEIFSFNKLTGIWGDYYNPASNTIHLFSNDAAIALQECGHAKDFNSRLNPSLYKLNGPFWVKPVAVIDLIVKKYLAMENAIQYIKSHHDEEFVKHSFRVLVPMLAINFAVPFIFDMNEKAIDLISDSSSTKIQDFLEAGKIACIGTMAIVTLGHLIGRVLASQYSKIDDVQPREELKNHDNPTNTSLESILQVDQMVR